MRRAEQGFTLIELLVVIAIIAILAAILFPIFRAAKGSALRATGGSNLSQAGKAMKMYTSDWSNITPPWGGVIPWRYSGEGGERPWAQRIGAYYDGNQEMCICPVTAAMLTQKRPMCSYILNHHLIEADITLITEADKVVMIYETNCVGRTPSSPCAEDWDPSSELMDPDPDWERTGDDANSWYLLRFPGPHSGIENILFADSHVRGFRRWNGRLMTFRPAKTRF